MIIKLSSAVARSAEPVVSTYSPAEARGFDPLSSKIVVLDPTLSGFQDLAQALSRSSGAKSAAGAGGIRLKAPVKALWKAGLAVSKAAVVMSEERSERARANIIDSGLGRRPSEFYPEAA